MKIKEKIPKGFQVVGSSEKHCSGFSLKAFSYTPNYDAPSGSIDDALIELAGSIIKQTALDLFDSDPLVRADAHNWLQSDEDRRPKVSGGLSFVFICDSFGIEPEWLRKKLYEFAHLKALEKAEVFEVPPETYVNRIPRNEK